MGKVLVDHVVLDRETKLLVYRLRFPPTLVPFIPRVDGRGTGRKEFRRSLRGRAMGEPGVVERWQAAQEEYARIVAAAEAAATLHRKRASGAYDVLDPVLINFLLDQYRHRQLLNDQQARFDPDVKAWGEFITTAAERAGYVVPPCRPTARWSQGFRLATEAALEAYRGYSADGALENILEAWSQKAHELAASFGYLLDGSTPQFQELCIRLNETAIAVHEAELQRQDGKIVETPPPPPQPARRGGVQARAELLPLLNLFDAYAVAQELKPRTRSEWRRFLELFIEFLGHDDARAVTEDDVMRWRDHLLVTPRRNGRAPLPVTVRDKYILPIKCTLKYAAEDVKVLQANVAAGVKVRVPRAVRTRPPYYSFEEARAVLLASLEPPQQRLAEPSVFARRWIPWLCAYSGARVGELAQLRREDISEVDGVWVMNITPEAGTVKTGQARLVPLHAHIIEQGFLEELKKHKGGPLFYTPSRRRTGDDGLNRHISKVGERIAAWVRQDVGITDTGIKPNHAWRHLFTTVAEDAGLPERTVYAILGHAAMDVGRKYGGSMVTAKAKAMLLFPRFDLGAPAEAPEPSPAPAVRPTEGCRPD